MKSSKIVARVNFGNIVFERGSEGKPASSEAKGNVTINHSEIAATLPKFIVTFMTSTSQDGGNGKSNTFHWDVELPQHDMEGYDQPYSTVEREAFAIFVSQINGLSDELNNQLEASKEKAAKSKSEKT